MARHMIAETEHPRFGTVSQVVSAVRVGAEPANHRRAPLRNEDAVSVLEGLLRYSPKRVRDLDESGAFGANDEKQHANAEEV